MKMIIQNWYKRV